MARNQNKRNWRISEAEGNWWKRKSCNDKVCSPRETAMKLWTQCIVVGMECYIRARILGFLYEVFLSIVDFSFCDSCPISLICLDYVGIACEQLVCDVSFRGSKNPNAVHLWTQEDVLTWLIEEVKLPQYKENMTELDFDGYLLVNTDKKQFIDHVGFKPEHASRIIKRLNSIQSVIQPNQLTLPKKEMKWLSTAKNSSTKNTMNDFLQLANALFDEAESITKRRPELFRPHTFLIADKLIQLIRQSVQDCVYFDILSEVNFS